MRKTFNSLFKPKAQKEEEKLQEEFTQTALNFFKTRRSIRKFLPEKPKWKVIYDIIEAGLNMPCAGNIENVSIIYIDNKEEIRRVAGICAQQFWICEAPILLVVVRNDQEVYELYPKDGKTYSIQASAAAAENLILLSHMHGLGSCWVEAFDNTVLKEELKIPQHCTIDAILPVGFPNESPQVPKTPLKSKLFFEKYGNKQRK